LFSLRALDRGLPILDFARGSSELLSQGLLLLLSIDINVRVAMLIT
jgi:hypothetical protein